MIPSCLWVSFDYCRFIELDYTPMESGIMVSMRQSRGFVTPKSPERHCRSALHHPSFFHQFCLSLLLFSLLFFTFLCSLLWHCVSMDSNSLTTVHCPYNIQFLILLGWGVKAWIALHMCVKVKDDFIVVVCKVNLCSHQIIMMVLLSLCYSAARFFLIIDSWLIFIMICASAHNTPACITLQFVLFFAVLCKLVVFFFFTSIKGVFSLGLTVCLEAC